MWTDIIHDYFFSGTLKEGGSWGGPSCTAIVPFRIHVYESIFWNSVCVLSFTIFNIRERFKSLISRARLFLNSRAPPSQLSLNVDLTLAFLHLAMWLQTVYYKINKRSLVNLFQPCHLCILLNGIAVSSSGLVGCLLSVMTLPLVTGGISAILFPDTTGLDQPFERSSFWMQHYFITFMPIYLLCRHDFVATKVSSVQSVLISNWLLCLIHWTFYEVGALRITVLRLYSVACHLFLHW